MNWPTYSTGEPITSGDWVRVYIPALGLWHHGIVRRLCWSGDGYAVEIIHKCKDVGVVVGDWYEFAGGGEIQLHQRGTQEHAQAIVARAEMKIGSPYSLFGFNCEHLASFAFAGNSMSSSVIAVGIVVVMAFIAAIPSHQTENV